MATIVLPNHKLIFIHITKCGGTSISHSLLDVADLTVWQKEQINSFRHHATYVELCANVPLRRILPEFDSFDVFATTRNPWERMLSAWLYISRKKKLKVSFDIWIKTISTYEPRRMFRPQISSLKDLQGKLAVPKDNIYDITQIEALYKRLSKIVGRKLKRLRINTSENRQHYSLFYTDKMISLVRKYHKQDIDTFGYSFEDRR